MIDPEEVANSMYAELDDDDSVFMMYRCAIDIVIQADYLQGICFRHHQRSQACGTEELTSRDLIDELINETQLHDYAYNMWESAAKCHALRLVSDVSNLARLANDYPVSFDCHRTRIGWGGWEQSYYDCSLAVASFWMLRLADPIVSWGEYDDLYLQEAPPFTLVGICNRREGIVRGLAEDFVGAFSYGRLLHNSRLDQMNLLKEAQRITGAAPWALWEMLPEWRYPEAYVRSKEERSSKRADSTTRAIELFQQGLAPRQVSMRLGLSAENARQIKSRARRDGLLDS